MSDAPAPPWREITIDDYVPRIFLARTAGAQWIASSDRVHELLLGKHEGRYRHLLTLR